MSQLTVTYHNGCKKLLRGRSNAVGQDRSVSPNTPLLSSSMLLGEFIFG